MSLFSNAAKAAVLLVFLPVAAYAAADDPCAAMIPKGAYQLVDQTGNAVHFNTAKEMFCSSLFHDDQQSNSWNFNLQAEGYGGAGGGSSNQANDTDRQNFCGDSTKDLTTVDQSFLYRLQGDQTLVSGFIACEKLRILPPGSQFAAYTATATTTTGVAMVTITPHLSANARERITSIGLLGLSEVGSNVSVPAGTELLPGVAITGGYAFTQNQGAIFIHTTTGDEMLTVTPCLDGTPAGTASATATVTTQQLQVTDHPSFSVTVPRAGCADHCHLGEGDPYSFTLTAPAGESLSNARLTACQGGCGFRDNESITQSDPSHIVYNVRSRSGAMQIVITADGSTMVNSTSTVTLLPATPVTFGTPFSVVVPNGDTGAVLTYNALSVPLGALTSGLINGTQLNVLDPGTNSSGVTTFTFEPLGPACSVTAQVQ